MLFRLRPRFRPRGVFADNDGDTHAAVLIKLPVLDSRRFLNQASGAPFDCQAIPSLPSRKPLLTDGCSEARPAELFYVATDIPVTANRSPRRSTAQAILASLLAKATIATLRWARLASPFAHRPSGVSRSATWASAARAPWISCLRRYLLPRLLIPSSFGLPPVVN